MLNLSKWLVLFVVLCGCGDNSHDRFGAITFVDGHGIEVAANSWPVDQGEFESVVSETLTLWQNGLNQEGVSCGVLVAVDLYTVSWTGFPFYDERLEGPLAGLTEWVGVRLVSTVGFRMPLNSSALGHELGHVVLARCGQDWNHPTMLYYAENYGTPY